MIANRGLDLHHHARLDAASVGQRQRCKEHQKVHSCKPLRSIKQFRNVFVPISTIMLIVKIINGLMLLSKIVLSSGANQLYKTDNVPHTEGNL